MWLIYFPSATFYLQFCMVLVQLSGWPRTGTFRACSIHDGAHYIIYRSTKHALTFTDCNYGGWSYTSSFFHGPLDLVNIPLFCFKLFFLGLSLYLVLVSYSIKCIVHFKASISSWILFERWIKVHEIDMQLVLLSLKLKIMVYHPQVHNSLQTEWDKRFHLDKKHWRPAK